MEALSVKVLVLDFRPFTGHNLMVSCAFRLLNHRWLVFLVFFDIPHQFVSFILSQCLELSWWILVAGRLLSFTSIHLARCFAHTLFTVYKTPILKPLLFYRRDNCDIWCTGKESAWHWHVMGAQGWVGVWRCPRPVTCQCRALSFTIHHISQLSRVTRIYQRSSRHGLKMNGRNWRRLSKNMGKLGGSGWGDERRKKL